MQLTFAFKLINFLCVEKEDDFQKLFKEYVAKYARVATEPSMRQHLIRVIRLWFRIEELESGLDALPMKSKEWIQMNKLYLDMITKWSLLLTRMGTTYTGQQYIKVDDREVQSAAELIELTNKLNGFAKEKATQVRKRLNPGGERKAAEGPPINIAKRKKKKKDK